jgi:hypothetical protein
VLRRKLEAEPTVVAGTAFENHERLTLTLRFANAARTSAEPIPRRSYSGGTASGVRVSTSRRPPASSTKSVPLSITKPATLSPTRATSAKPGRKRGDARIAATMSATSGAVGERASHDVIDRGVVGVLLGLDNEVVHSPTLDRTPLIDRFITPTVLRSGPNSLCQLRARSSASPVD